MSNSMTSLETIRRTGGRILATVSVAMALISIVTAWLMDKGDITIALVLCLAVTIAPVMMALQQRTDTVALMTYGITLPAYSMIMIYLLRGHALQMDMHMLFFALLASLVLLCEWRAVLAGAVLGAVHHIMLNFVAPDLVFLGGGNFGRLVLHAAVVIAEAAVLIWIATKMPGLIDFIMRQNAEREESERLAQAGKNAAYEAQKNVVHELKNGLERLAQGDVSQPIKVVFSDEYDALRVNFNAALSAMNDTLQSLTDAADSGADRVG